MKKIYKTTNPTVSEFAQKSVFMVIKESPNIMDGHEQSNQEQEQEQPAADGPPTSDLDYATNEDNFDAGEEKPLIPP